jgi:hypothetical protein
MDAGDQATSQQENDSYQPSAIHLSYLQNQVHLKKRAGET